MLSPSDTIAAIATPLGEGGIGVIGVIWYELAQPQGGAQTRGTSSDDGDSGAFKRRNRVHKVTRKTAGIGQTGAAVCQGLAGGRAQTVNGSRRNSTCRSQIAESLSRPGLCSRFQ